MTEESRIVATKSHTAFIGPDATELIRAIYLRQAILMLVRTQNRLKLTRGMNMTRCLAMTERYTGQKYKRTESERALRDLNVWIETMKSALPVERVD